MKKNICFLLFVCLLVMTPVMNASTILNPGTTAVPNLDNSTPLGVLLASTTVTLAPLSQTFSGTEHEEVYQMASGFLVFAYQFNVGPGTGNPVVSDPVVRATMNPYSGFTTSVSYRTQAFGGFTASTNNPGSADRNVSGDTVGFDTFGASGAGVSASNSSSVMLIFTNATNFTRQAFMSVSDGGTATNFALGPAAAAVPEPATMTLMGSALLGFGLLGRWKYKRSKQ
jgi:hypothetical protein